MDGNTYDLHFSGKVFWRARHGAKQWAVKLSRLLWTWMNDVRETAKDTSDLIAYLSTFFPFSSNSLTRLFFLVFSFSVMAPFIFS